MCNLWVQFSEFLEYRKGTFVRGLNYRTIHSFYTHCDMHDLEEVEVERRRVIKRHLIHMTEENFIYLLRRRRWSEMKDEHLYQRSLFIRWMCCGSVIFGGRLRNLYG